MTDRRDFIGHGGQPPMRHWPNGAGLAVSFVVNVEEGAELSIADGDECNEFIYEAVEPVEGEIDLCMESHFEYGPRAGWPRIRQALQDRRVPATLNACGRAIARLPWLAQEAVADGHEIAAHGYRWERHVHMDAVQERKAIADCSDAIAAACGEAPVGWHTRSATSPRTRDLLQENGGFLYDSNAYNDDIPFTVPGPNGPHVVLPYAFDTNDMRFFNRGGFVFAEDFSRYCIAAFDRLLDESAHAPRMLSIGLHLRIIGRPARISGLEQVLDHVLNHPDVWIARRDQIAHAWRAGLDLPVWNTR
ncbi:MAG: chitin deacetylase [Mameliella sp.]|nr:chitin deacetylase [Mameliella sp.]